MKIVVSILLLSLMAGSTAIAVTQAALAWPGALVTPNVLTVKGSSTVGPIAQEELDAARGNFPGYWNNLVAANSAWGTPAALNINSVSLATDGSGTAVPALALPNADVGEMSRPPSTGEYSNAAMTNMQLWAVGIDSVAIVVSPDMTGFPTSLTTLQVASLFANTSPLSNLPVGNGGTPIFATWGAFMTYWNIPNTLTAQQLAEPIKIAVRDPTSGTADCFNNYFMKPNGVNVLHTSNSVTDNYQNLASYTLCTENIDVFNAVSQGSTSTGSDYVGFISLGYLESYGNMIGVNIQFNIAAPPSGQTVPSLLKYYGNTGTWGKDNPSIFTWGTAAAPTQPNVLWAVSGIKGTAATSQYGAWRWLWEVTPATIPSTGPTLAAGVWIAYMKNATYQGHPTNFVKDNNYIELNRADMAGGAMIDSNLLSYTPIGGQTTQIPDGKDNFRDLSYFVSAYIAYGNANTYNPYADMDANGKINFNDLKAFVSTYINYFVNYNP